MKKILHWLFVAGLAAAVTIVVLLALLWVVGAGQ